MSGPVQCQQPMRTCTCDRCFRPTSMLGLVVLHIVRRLYLLMVWPLTRFWPGAMVQLGQRGPACRLGAALEAIASCARVYGFRRLARSHAGLVPGCLE